MEVFFLAASLQSSALSQSHRASDILQQLAADPQLLEEVVRGSRHLSGDATWDGGLVLAEAQAPVQDGGRRLAGRGRRLGGASFHSIFFLTCNPSAEPTDAHCNYWDWQMLGMWLAVLVVVTLVIEAVVFERLEEAAESSTLATHIYQKMVRELALLGLVSFTAIIMVNTVIGHALKEGSEWRFLMLEIAHVMIFVMAIMFCLAIFFVYLMVRSIEHEWARIEDPQSSIGKPDYDPWTTPLELLEKLNLSLPQDSLRGHALSEGSRAETVLPPSPAHALRWGVARCRGGQARRRQGGSRRRRGGSHRRRIGSL